MGSGTLLLAHGGTPAVVGDLLAALSTMTFAWAFIYFGRKSRRQIAEARARDGRRRAAESG